MEALAKWPKIDLTGGPTPLMALPRLSQHLGQQIYIKRDDCTALAGGGNKARKLEYLLADAIHSGADVIVTIGGIQSNHARQTAAAAAKLGLDCHLVLEDVEGTPESCYYDNGNILLDQLLGASIHHIDLTEDIDRYAQQLVQKLKHSGRKPYFIALGGSTALGNLGYVRCANEMIQQLQAQQITMDTLVVASGSAGTQAGLLAGFILANVDIKVIGISVSRERFVQQTLVTNMLNDTLAFLAVDAPDSVKKVHVYDDYYGQGYGRVNDQTIETIEQCAALEGLILDPVYTAKAMVGLIDLCAQGVIPKDHNTLFLHTGGTAGLFAYGSVFEHLKIKRK